MTPEERQLLAGLFERTRAASGNYRDPDAEGFIADAVRQQPYAPYLLAQTVIVQEQALQAASQRLQDLEAHIRELEQQASKPASGGFLGGLGSSIFGSPSQSQAPRSSVPPSGSTTSPWSRQPETYAQPPAAPAPSPWQNQQAGGWAQSAPPQGGSFLKGALGAAAGVAGGVLLANSLSGLFSGHNNHLGIGSGLDGQSAAGTGGFDPFPAGRVGDAQPASYEPTAADDARQDEEQDRELGYDDAPSSDWGSGDDTTDV